MVTSSSMRQLHRRLLAWASDLENLVRRFVGQAIDTQFLYTLLGK